MSYVDIILNDAPLAYLRTGELSGTTAVDEMGAHSGAYSGGYTLGQPALLPSGDPNTSVLFDGVSGNISIPDAVALEFTTLFSLEYWIYYLTMPGANPGGLAKGVQWYMVGKSNGHFELGGVNSGSAFVGAASTGVGSFTTGSAYHVAGSYDGSNWRIYLNGALMQTLAGTSAPATSTQPVQVGGGGTSPLVGDFIHAYVDEIAMYNYRLSDAQVQEHYAGAAVEVKPHMDSYAHSMTKARAQ